MVPVNGERSESKKRNYIPNEKGLIQSSVDETIESSFSNGEYMRWHLTDCFTKVSSGNMRRIDVFHLLIRIDG
jgi:actin-related protein